MKNKSELMTVDHDVSEFLVDLLAREYDLPVTCMCQHAEDLGNGGVMYLAYITPKRPLYVDDIQKLGDVVERFVCNEDLVVQTNGKDFRIGDGDDMLSSYMLGGVIVVWVRYLPE